MKTRDQDTPYEYPGAWWPAGEPDKQKIGRLKIEPGGKATLVLDSVHQRTAFQTLVTDARRESESIRAVIFHGHDENGEPFTLFGCVRINTHTAMAFSTETFDVAMVVKGRHYTSHTEIRLDQVYLDFAYMQEWLEGRGVRLKQEENEKIILDKPSGEERISATDQGYSVVRQSSLGSESNAKEIRFSSRERLGFRFDEPWGLDRVHELVIDLQWLMTLAVGLPVPVTGLTGLSNDWLIAIGDKKIPKPMDFFIHWPGWDTRRRNPHRSDMLFTVSAFADGLGLALARWRDYRQKHHAVLSCYFSTIFNRHLYANHEFLFLAHALELYHQLHFDGSYQPAVDFKMRIDRIAAIVPDKDEATWLRERLAGANRKTLADRLRELIAAKQPLLGELVPDSEKFVQRVKDTRNYYTHYDEELPKKGRVAEDAELYETTQAMRALLEVCFLQDLGISPAAISKVIKPRGTYVKFF